MLISLSGQARTVPPALPSRRLGLAYLQAFVYIAPLFAYINILSHQSYITIYSCRDLSEKGGSCELVPHCPIVRRPLHCRFARLSSWLIFKSLLRAPACVVSTFPTRRQRTQSWRQPGGTCATWRKKQGMGKKGD